MCIACELSFWNMIDALPPEDARADPARAGRALCLRRAGEPSRTPAPQANADERKP